MEKVNLKDYSYEYGSHVSKPTAEENSCSFTLDNQSKYVVKKWAIDRKVFKDRTQKRCDYLLLVERKKNNIYYWIELKGSDVSEAYKQILSTINNINIERTAIYRARIISTRTYALELRGKEYAMLEEIISRNGGKIIVRNIHYTETI